MRAPEYRPGTPRPRQLSITLDVYSHVTRDMQADAAAMVAGLIGDAR
jgi:hypothetical protein